MIKTLKVLVGPTSSGKTSLALDLCKKEKGVIVSADSRQVYKEMDIGTGKVPSDKEMAVEKGDKKWAIEGVDIWGYDLAAPDEYFSAYDYAAFAINKINELSKNPDYEKIILVGGTGFYIDIVTGRMELEGTEPDFELRKELEELTARELSEKLMSLNLNAFEKIDKNNPARLIRAIEKEINRDHPRRPLPKLEIKDFDHIGLTAPRQILYRKADAWLDSVWKKGLLSETEELMQKYPSTPKLKGLVYKEALSYITGREPEDSAIQKAKFSLHAYIRRQETWFKKNPAIKWIDTVIIP